MKRLFVARWVAFGLFVSLLVSCSNVDSSTSVSEDCCKDPFAIENLSLREKVGQMFLVRPEALDTSIHWKSYTELPDYSLQEVNRTMLAVNEDYPIGGMILFAHNIKDESQLATFIEDIRKLKGLPLGTFDVAKYESMAAVAAAGDPNEVYKMAFTIGSYVREYGFDIDFAPVADVNTNPENIVIGPRAFSDTPEVVADMVQAYLQGLDSAKVVGTLKHFPGHGDVKADTHTGYVATQKTWEEMKTCEMVPFKAGIDAGAQMIMTAHIAAPKVTGNNLPSTLSPVILQEKLRGELGFKGIIVADAMDMGAIVQEFGVEESKAFDAVMKAVEKGEIKESRIDESVRRILELKKSIKR